MQTDQRRISRVVHLAGDVTGSTSLTRCNELPAHTAVRGVGLQE